MEPMTLGSAPSSPASPSINSNFLPGFLMGDNQPANPSPSISPGRNRTSGNFKMSMPSEPRSLRQKLFNQSLSESPSMSPFSAHGEKAGPPKMGLYDVYDARKPTSPIMSSTVAHYGESPNFNESVSCINNDESLNFSRTAVPKERIDTPWVTVFGFPPSALTVVLSQMMTCGPVVDKKIPTQGNWMHLKYSGANEIARALAMNGKCLNNQIMIGVQLHYSKENKENDNSAVYTSPMRARSLRHSFVSPGGSNTVVAPQTVPQKSTGLVTKAMEYVFGW